MVLEINKLGKTDMKVQPYGFKDTNSVYEYLGLRVRVLFKCGNLQKEILAIILKTLHLLSRCFFYIMCTFSIVSIV